MDAPNPRIQSLLAAPSEVDWDAVARDPLHAPLPEPLGVEERRRALQFVRDQMLADGDMDAFAARFLYLRRISVELSGALAAWVFSSEAPLEAGDVPEPAQSSVWHDHAELLPVATLVLRQWWLGADAEPTFREVEIDPVWARWAAGKSAREITAELRRVRTMPDDHHYDEHEELTLADQRASFDPGKARALLIKAPSVDGGLAHFVFEQCPDYLPDLLQNPGVSHEMLQPVRRAAIALADDFRTSDEAPARLIGYAVALAAVEPSGGGPRLPDWIAQRLNELYASNTLDSTMDLYHVMQALDWARAWDVEHVLDHWERVGVPTELDVINRIRRRPEAGARFARVWARGAQDARGLTQAIDSLERLDPAGIDEPELLDRVLAADGVAPVQALLLRTRSPDAYVKLIRRALVVGPHALRASVIERNPDFLKRLELDDYVALLTSPDEMCRRSALRLLGQMTTEQAERVQEQASRLVRSRPRRA